MFEKRMYFEQHLDGIRKLMLREPRGYPALCANVILPPEPLLARGHYDVALLSLAIHNVANYSPPVFELQPGEMPEWEIMLRLTAIAAGQGAHADIDALERAEPVSGVRLLPYDDAFTKLDDELLVLERHSGERTTLPRRNQRRRGPKGRVLGAPAAAVTPAIGHRRP